MSAWLPWLVVALPLAAAAGLFALRGRPAGWGALAALGLTLIASLALPWLPADSPATEALLRADPLATHMAILAAAGAVLAAWHGRAALTGHRAALVPFVLGPIELAALANNPALAWAGLEAAVLALLLSAPRQGEAQWRALLAMALALASTLLGGVLLYRAGVPVLGTGLPALRWDVLAAAAPTLSPALLSLGFILLLGGLAACAGLAPLHAWHGPAGRGNALARGLLPALAAVALELVLRARDIVMRHDDAVDPGPALVALGLASLSYAVLGIWRGSMPVAAAAWLFQGGLAAIAFGTGGTAADAAGLVLLSTAVLALPLLPPHPAGRGDAALLALLALLPPFAPFGAALVLLGAAMDDIPWLAVPLAALIAAGAAGLLRAAIMAWQAPSRPPAQDLPAALVPALALAAGIAPQAARWFEALAEGLR